MADIQLKHRNFRENSRLYFYDGSKPVKKGVVTIPSGRTDWAGAAFLRGYVLDAETGREMRPGEIRARVLAPTVTVVDDVTPVAPKTTRKPRTRRTTTKRKTTAKKTA